MKKIVSVLLICVMITGCSARKEHSDGAAAEESSVSETESTSAEASSSTREVSIGTSDTDKVVDETSMGSSSSSESTTSVESSSVNDTTSEVDNTSNKEETSSVSSSVTSSSTSTASTPSVPVVEEPTWTEEKTSSVLYVNKEGIYSRKDAVVGSAAVKKYGLNDKVSVVAVTNTDYYKLEDGTFIHKDYLSDSTADSNSNTTSNTTVAGNGSKYEQALKIANEVADFVKETAGPEKSLKQISCAAEVISFYFYRYCAYSETADALTAYGVFIANKASCQGAADALGMVLDLLGYKWEHINKSQHTHQWCDVYFEYSQEVITREGETITIKGTIVHADASVPLGAYIGLGGEYGNDALYFSYSNFVEETETGVLHESTGGVIF